ncbi:MAG: type II toxin-antitoxin system RelE/ParE family toxin [Armatimonadetes bacterium]|nr:type II toxin-antitoxin system RelE/ParE family toxin [Armatimonadota bacterium]
MSRCAVVVEPAAEQDVESAVDWYEAQRGGLSHDFLDPLRAAIDRIAEQPLVYQDLRAGVRRVLLRRFPYCVYFAVEGEAVVVLAVLHAGRDPEEWQRRRG